MNRIFLVLLCITIFGCSNSDDNCQSNKDEINAKYDKQVKQVMDNPGPGGIDYRQIGLLNDERSKKLSEACN